MLELSTSRAKSVPASIAPRSARSISCCAARLRAGAASDDNTLFSGPGHFAADHARAVRGTARCIACRNRAAVAQTVTFFARRLPTWRRPSRSSCRRIVIPRTNAVGAHFRPFRCVREGPLTEPIPLKNSASRIVEKYSFALESLCASMIQYTHAV
jgi:hypothetical protein